jgi:hypothetical protein
MEDEGSLRNWEVVPFDPQQPGWVRSQAPDFLKNGQTKLLCMI